MLKLTLALGGTVLVNPAHIVTVRRCAKARCEVQMVTGVLYQVCEAAEEIAVQVDDAASRT